jgi:hypothetical protein
MRGTNDTFGADGYTDWSIVNSGANLVFSSADNGSTNARVTVDYEGDLWVGLTPVTHHSNRHAFFHNTGGCMVSITSGSSATAGIVFGDSAANTTANYESYIAHWNVNDSLYLYTDQGNKGLELKKAGDVHVIDGNLSLASGHGIDFSVNSHESSMSSELFDGYEEGTFTPTIWKGTTQSSLTDSWGKYIKIGGIVHFSFYCFRNWDSSGLSNGSEIWQVGFPFTVIGANGGAWSFIPAGYCRVNSAGPTNDQTARWQSNSNSGTKLTLYSSNNTTNWTSGYIEFSGSGTAYLS